MSPVAIASIAFGLILAATLTGTLIRHKLPEHHVTGDSKEVIRLATALVGTLTAVVLALLFAATRTSFEHTSAQVSRLAADMTELDELLEQYGPEALPIRKKLRAELQPLIDSIWREDAEAAGRPSTVKVPHDTTGLFMVRQLEPKTPMQASLHQRALLIGTDISQIRIQLFAQPPDSVSTPFMVVMVLWLMFIFATFSMSAKPNPTLTTVLAICILSASIAIYLIIELGLPFGGLMQVANDSLRQSLPPM